MMLICFQKTLPILLAAGMLISSCKPEGIPPAETARPLSTARAENTLPTQPAATRRATVAASPLPIDSAGLRGLRIKLWHTLPGGAAESLETLEARFNATNPWGILVDAVRFSGSVELIETLTGNLDPISLPEIVSLPVEFAAVWNQAGQEVSGLGVFDLNRYMHDPVWGMAEPARTGLVTSLWQAQETGGVLLGAPFDASARYFAYNQTWAAELGFDGPPANLEDFKAQACAAARVNQQAREFETRGTGGWPVESDPQTILSWIAAFGGEPGSAGSETLNFNNTPSLAAFSYLQTLYDEGCIWTARKSDHSGYLAARQALLISARPQDIPRIAFEMTRAGGGDAWTLLPFPGRQGSPVLISSGPALSILETGEERQLAAWLFIRWLVETRNQAEFLAGSFSLPVANEGGAAAAARLAAYPQWQAAADQMEAIIPGLRQAAWLAGRDVLEDAFLQLFMAGTQPGDEQAILEMLDATLAELGNSQP